jgi:predicted aldo/keto reductase-like oxidoreductase
VFSKRSLSNVFASTDKSPGTIPTRPLGKTGFHITTFSLGGEILLEEEPPKIDAATALINRALDLGINYIDTSPMYGKSEILIGNVMNDRRSEVFLASKTHDRSYDGSMRLLERSLKRLQTDHLDLWQIHNVRLKEDVDYIFAREGVIHALEKAKEEKLVNHVGITGHRDPQVLLRAIHSYEFDTILMALNAADKHHASFIEELLPTAVDKNLGILAMKVVSRGKLFRSDGISGIEQAMRYVLSLPVSSALIGVATIAELEENVRIAKEFTSLTQTEMEELEERTKHYHEDALWYKQLW